MAQFIIDETQLSTQFGFDVPLLRVFNLETFEIPTQRFLDFLRPSFSMLTVDPYDTKRAQVMFLRSRFPDQAEKLDAFLPRYWAGQEDLESFFNLIYRLGPEDNQEFDRIGFTYRRKRSLARFILLRRGCRNDWQIDRVGASSFRQNVAQGDVRKFERKFSEMSEIVTNNTYVRQLIQGLARLVGHLHPEQNVLSMNLHQIYVFADMMSAGEGAAEGIHKDGAQYIVSALVIERAGITGGESIIYAEDKKTELLRRTLQPGEGIFQADEPLWHYVTPIQEDHTALPHFGHRSILGIDINLVK